MVLWVVQPSKDRHARVDQDAIGVGHGPLGPRRPGSRRAMLGVRARVSHRTRAPTRRVAPKPAIAAWEDPPDVLGLETRGHARRSSDTALPPFGPLSWPKRPRPPMARVGEAVCG